MVASSVALQALDSPSRGIAELKAKVLQARTPEEIAAIWEEVHALQSKAAQPPTHPAAKLLAEGGPWTWRTPAADLLKLRLDDQVHDGTYASTADSSSEENSAGDRTPASQASSTPWPTLAVVGMPSSKSQPDVTMLSEDDDESPKFIIRNTFIDAVFVDEEEEAPAPKRRAQSCPHISSGSDCSVRTLGTLSEAAQRLRLLQEEAVPEAPASIMEEGSLDARPRPLSLASYLAPEAVEAPAVCPPGMPSVGSTLHAVGRCKPCAFVHTKGCSSGEACLFCHLCEPGCSKRRKKAWRQQQQQNEAAWRQYLRSDMPVRTMTMPAPMMTAYPPSPTAWVVCPR